MNLRGILEALHIVSPAPPQPVSPPEPPAAEPQDRVGAAVEPAPPAPPTTPTSTAAARPGTLQNASFDGGVLIATVEQQISGSFDRIEIQGAGKLRILQGDGPHVEIAAQVQARGEDATEASAQAALAKSPPVQASSNGQQASIKLAGDAPAEAMPEWARRYVGLCRIRGNSVSFNGSVNGSISMNGNSVTIEEAGHTLQISESGVTLDGKRVDPNASATQPGVYLEETVIRVPKGKSIELSQTDGTVHVQGLEGGSVTLKGSGQPITLMRISAPLDVSNPHGDVLMLKCGDATVRSAGSLSTSGCSGAFKLIDHQGSVEIDGGAEVSSTDPIRGSVDIANVPTVKLGAVGSALKLTTVETAVIGEVRGSVELSRVQDATFDSVGSSLNNGGGGRLKSGSIRGSAEIYGATTVEVGHIGSSAEVNRADSVQFTEVRGSTTLSRVKHATIGSVGSSCDITGGEVNIESVRGSLTVDGVSGRVASVGSSVSGVTSSPNLQLGQVRGSIS